MLEKIHTILKDKECRGNVICFVLAFVIIVYGLGFAVVGFAWLGDKTSIKLWQEVDGKIIKTNKYSKQIRRDVEILRNMLANKDIQKRLLEN